MKKTVSLVLSLVLCLALAVPALAGAYKVSPVSDPDSDVVVTDVILESNATPPEYIYLTAKPFNVPEDAKEFLESLEKSTGTRAAEVVEVKLWMDTDAADRTGYPKDIGDVTKYFTVTTTFERKSSGTVVAVWGFNSGGTWSRIAFSASGSTVTCTFKNLTYDFIVFMVEDEDAEHHEKTEPGENTESAGGRKSPQTGDNSLWLVGGTVSLMCAAAVCCRKGRKIKD